MGRFASLPYFCETCNKRVYAKTIEREHKGHDVVIKPEKMVGEE